MEMLGITENELRVYETLLANGASTISALSQKVKLDQRSTYDCVERLIHKGVVGQIMRNNKRLFLGLNPDTMSFLIDEEKKKAELEFKSLSEQAKQHKEELALNLIGKPQLLRMLKRLNGKAEASYITETALKDEPAWNYFLANAKVKRLPATQADVIVIFWKDMFLMYSVHDEVGFFLNNSEFSESMKVYFR